MTVDDQNQGAMLRVSSREFTITLADNETAQAFAATLPMTIQMSDVNSSEKAYNLPNSLPSAATNLGKIESGDVMLYGSRMLVVFYESFSTTYTYTRTRVVDNPSGLQDALGSGDVTVAIQAI